MKPRYSNDYVKYMGLALQLFVMLALLLFLGQKIDASFDYSHDYFTALLPIFGLILYFIRMYYDLMRES